MNMFNCEGFWIIISCCIDIWIKSRHKTYSTDDCNLSTAVEHFYCWLRPGVMLGEKLRMVRHCSILSEKLSEYVDVKGDFDESLNDLRHFIRYCVINSEVLPFYSSFGPIFSAMKSTKRPSLSLNDRFISWKLSKNDNNIKLIIN